MQTRPISMCGACARLLGHIESVCDALTSRVQIDHSKHNGGTNSAAIRVAAATGTSHEVLGAVPKLEQCAETLGDFRCRLRNLLLKVVGELDLKALSLASIDPIILEALVSCHSAGDGASSVVAPQLWDDRADVRGALLQMLAKGLYCIALATSLSFLVPKGSVACRRCVRDLHLRCNESARGSDDEPIRSGHRASGRSANVHRDVVEHNIGRQRHSARIEFR
eukprot:SAG31_NODE_3528_length_4153_cov_1.648249_3_plen_223_part_00